MLGGGAPSVAAIVRPGQLHDHFISRGDLLSRGGAGAGPGTVCASLGTLVPFTGFLRKWVAGLRLQSKGLEDFRQSSSAWRSSRSGRSATLFFGRQR